MDFFLDPAIWASFITLVALEIVLGIDNLILISILSDKLPAERRRLARKLGLVIALITRIMLLSCVFFLAKPDQEPLFIAFGKDFSWREIILVIGGLFLLGKGTTEIHHKIEGEDEAFEMEPKYSALPLVIGQIVLMDIVFSFDSVLTAVGVADHIEVMISAIIVSVIFMVMAVNWVSDFISNHPTLKVLALSYMLLIGMALVGEGFHMDIPKGYLYFAMAFSFSVEGINMIIRDRDTKKKLKVLPKDGTK